jgi:alpha-galactosidase
MINISIQPDFTFSISDAGTELGKMRFRIIHNGEDLLANGIIKDQSTRNNDKYYIWSSSDCPGLELFISIQSTEDNWVGLECKIENNGKKDISFEKLVIPEWILNPDHFSVQKGLWTMQGAAVGWGQDFAFKMPVPFERENYLGHLQEAEGGGIPINYFWNRERGMALMHTEPVPREWYMPVRATTNKVDTALEFRHTILLHPREEYPCPRVIISLHHGDFFEPLSLYRSQMEQQGMAPAQPTSACFEPAWCSWGYEFDVTPGQMIGALPAVRKLGIEWLTLDDRWFDFYGDWNPRADTFPGGENAIRTMNDRIHQAGGFDQIWWYPLCAEDGYGDWEGRPHEMSRILKDHPDWLVLNEDGSVARNNRHLAMLCPALPEVQEYTRGLTEKFIADWGFDGYKLDNIYTMPACHNPLHHHASPEDSVAAFAKVYQIIFETTRRLKPNSVTQICPCGTPITHSLMPFTDQTVTADPTSSQQIRQRIKFYKALMGPRAAVFADHVELSNGGNDFASEIGCGGVPATKFVYPEDETLKKTLKEYWNLTPEKQSEWKRWFDLYDLHRPAEGEYLNLYDLGYDVPEAHAIRKGDDFYYAFFANDFHGEVQLRGLENRSYQVQDYVTGTHLAKVTGTLSTLHVNFHGSLLLLAKPE